MYDALLEEFDDDTVARQPEDEEGFAAAGFGSVADVTSCPGTDTCNLGISNSTSTAIALSEVIEEEFPEFLYNKELAIKISGCNNS